MAQLVGKLTDWLYELRLRRDEDQANKARAKATTQSTIIAETTNIEGSALAGSDVTLLPGLEQQQEGQQSGGHQISRFADVIVDARGAALTESLSASGSVAIAAHYAWTGATLASAIHTRQEVGTQSTTSTGWLSHLVDVQMALSQLLALGKAKPGIGPLFSMLQSLETEGGIHDAATLRTAEQTRLVLTLPSVPRPRLRPVLPYEGAPAPIRLEMLRVIMSSAPELYEINVSDMRLLLEHCYGNLAEQLALIEVENARATFSNVEPQLAFVEPPAPATRETVLQVEEEEQEPSPPAQLSPRAFELLEAPATLTSETLFVTPLSEVTAQDPYESAYAATGERAIADVSFYEAEPLALSPSRLPEHEVFELETALEPEQEQGELFVQDPFDLESYLNLQ